MLNIPTFNGRKSYHPDLQINKGQLDRIINAAYYQLIKKKKKKDHITYRELYSKKKKKAILKKEIITYSIVIKPTLNNHTLVIHSTFSLLCCPDHSKLCTTPARPFLSLFTVPEKLMNVQLKHHKQS